MARHENGMGDSITYRWRIVGMETPRWLDLHPVVNNWRGPRWLVVAAYWIWRCTVRSQYVDRND